MPTPQCPECGRFLAAAFVEELATEPAPCPGCGVELAEGPVVATVAAEPAPPTPPPAALAEAEDVEPEPTTSVRPPDLDAGPDAERDPDRDPLEGWDEHGTFPAPTTEPDPVVLATGAGLGLLLGLLLGGRRHRALGAVLGALLGAVVARLRG